MANVNIPDLDPGAAVADAHLFETTQGGINKKVTGLQIKNYIGAGSGTVTSVSVGNLSPLFTASVATATTTPAISFALVVQNANKVFAGPTNGVDAAPTFRALVAADIPDLSAVYYPSGNPSGYISGNQTITLGGEASGSGATSITATLSNAAVIAKVLTGFASGAGALSATDTILQAIQKLDGNIIAKVSSQWTTTGSDIYYSTGNVMVGAASAPSSKLHIIETSTSTPRGILVDQYNTGTNGARITMRKGRGSFASPTTIVTGDVLASWTASGYDGANFIESGKLITTSEGTINTNIVPSKMDLQTANSSGTLTTGLSLSSAQVLTIPAYTTANGILYTNGLGVVSQATVGSLPGLGTGVGAWLVTPSWSNFSTAITGTAPYWATTGTSTMTAGTTLSSSFRLAHLFSGTWTSTTNADYHIQVSPTITADANTRTIHAVNIAPTMNTGGFSNTVLNAFRVNGRTVIKGLSTTNTNGTFVVTDSSDNGIIDVSDDGNERYGNAGSRPTRSATSDGTTLNKNGSGMLYSCGAQGQNFSVAMPGAGVANGRILRVGGTNTTSSGTTSYTGILMDYTVNQSGGTGDTYGIRHIPSYTAVGGTAYFIVDNSTSNSGLGTLTPTAKLHVVGTTKLEGSVTLPVAGNGVLIKEGTNATMGTATLSGGTVTVNTTKVTANSRIFLTINGGTLTNVGSTYISARSAGTSFTISSTNVLDASQVAWLLFEPA